MEEINKDIKIGKVRVLDKGFGFLILEDEEDVFISKLQTIKVFDGETVEAKIITSKGRKEAVISRVIKRKENFIGKVFKSKNKLMVQVSPNQRIDIINYSGIEGLIIKFKIIKYPSISEQAIGEFIEVIGSEYMPNIENKLAIFKHEIPSKFNNSTMEELLKIEKEISFENRFDLTNLQFITIDGEDSRDFDDAVYCETTEFGWNLYVAIADVAHYVKYGTELDKEALLRGNSVYLPNEVIPMLPEQLSNELCSLKPNEKRYAITVKINISRNGSVKSFKFMNSVIESKRRMTYNQVSNILEDLDSEFKNKDPLIHKVLLDLEKIYELLKEKRDLRGALEFEKKESSVIFNEKTGKISDLKSYKRRKSHKIIEESMLLANICAAKLLTKMKIKSLYRVHDKPKESKIETVKNVLGKIGLKLSGGELNIKSRSFNKLMKVASKVNDHELIKSTILKSMSKASYKVENKGHFGLAYDEYTHFTSPIRRYPDIVIHRGIKALINSSEGGKYVEKLDCGKGFVSDYYKYSVIELNEIANHISNTEKRADSASNDVFKSLKCQFLSDKTGQKFKGKITNLNNSNMYVEFEDYVAEGIVSYIDLPDYFVYIKDLNKVKGRSSKKEYKIGDPVNFKILKVNLETNNIYLKIED